MANTKFEYKVIEIYFLDNLEISLNIEGNQGWELVQIIPDEEGITKKNRVILKRKYYDNE